MALSPNIPTSFVPRPTEPQQRFRSDLSGAFGFFSYGILVIVVVMAVGVFLYGSILSAEQSSKDKALAAAVSAIDPTTANNFIRLNERLISSQTLLNNHIAFSGFFSLIDTILPTTVRFTSLHLTIDPTTGVAEVSGSGTAKTFNALAAASSAFASNGSIKDAIFSNIQVNKDNSVSFLLTAELDPKVIAFGSPAGSAAAPATTSAATSTPPSP